MSSVRAPYHKLTEDIGQIANEVTFEVEAPDIIVEHYVKRAITQFCERSEFWQEDIGPARVTSSTNTIEISSSRYSNIVQLKSIWVPGDDDNDYIELAKGNDYLGNTDWIYSQSSVDTISVFPHTELIGKDVIINAALKPIEYSGTFKFSEQILREYFDAIVAGTKGALYMIPNKMWTDIRLGSEHYSLFELEANKALARGNRGFDRTPKRIHHKARDFY